LQLENHMDNTTDIRTTKNIVGDLLEFALEHEWIERYNSRWNKWSIRCDECDADRGEFGEEDYEKHDPGCKLAALIKEAEAYIRVENEIEEESE
jgi:hypothetical protein